MPLHGRKQVDLAIKSLKVEANDGVREAYMSGLTHIISQTPADEGRARNNWFLSVMNPSNKTVASKSTSGANSHSQLAKMPRDVVGKKIYLTNNLPYINILEFGGFPNPVKKGSYDKVSGEYTKLSSGGFSLQAPNGWVRANIIKMKNKISRL